MRCEMCPRTTMMTRPIETMKKDTVRKDHHPAPPMDAMMNGANGSNLLQEKFSIKPDDMAENHFFLYVIPKVIVLHGYGDPLLDKNIPDYVAAMTKKDCRVISAAIRQISIWIARSKRLKMAWIM